MSLWIDVISSSFHSPSSFATRQVTVSAFSAMVTTVTVAALPETRASGPLTKRMLCNWAKVLVTPKEDAGRASRA